MKLFGDFGHYGHKKILVFPKQDKCGSEPTAFYYATCFSYTSGVTNICGEQLLLYAKRTWNC